MSVEQQDGFDLLNGMPQAAGAAEDGPLQMALRIADGRWDEAAQRAITKAFLVYLRAGAALGLERCIGLPNTTGRIRRAARDHWLAVAARQVDAPDRYTGCNDLADLWAVFVSRGGWVLYRHQAAPPPALRTELRRALWWATRYNNGKSLSWSRLFAIDTVVCAWPEKQSEIGANISTTDSAGGTHAY